MNPESQININESSVPLNTNKKATTSMVLGIIGMFAWFIPIFGLPITIIGLIMGIKGLNSERRNRAVVGITLCIIGLVLSIANASIGAYMGATGQHQFVNEVLDKPKS